MHVGGANVDVNHVCGATDVKSQYRRFDHLRVKMKRDGGWCGGWGGFRMCKVMPMGMHIHLGRGVATI